MRFALWSFKMLDVLKGSLSHACLDMSFALGDHGLLQHLKNS